MTEAVAPVLSTYQDEETFEFQKYAEVEHDRSYLGPGLSNGNSDDLIKRLSKYYAVPDLIDFLRGSKYKKITLQFPDHLVSDASIVVQLLQQALNEEEDDHHHHNDSNGNGHNKDQNDAHEGEVDHTKPKEKDDCSHQCQNCKCSDPLDVPQKQQIWILADTAYSACCVDEVAAEHVQADIVIHFGDACLNPIEKLDSVHVFGEPYLDVGKCIERFKENYQPEDKVILMANTPYTRYLPQIHEALKPHFPNVGFGDVDTTSCKIIGFEPSSTKSTLKFSNRLIKGIEINKPEELQDFSLFHITTPNAPYLLFLTTKFSTISIYEPSQDSINSGPFPSLMKRYRYMQMTRMAGTIGILINTLSIKNTKQVINRISSKIKEADKKYYLFVVGKPNVAKLANFENIEVWCILGCGQSGIIIDQTNEFYKPIITPYELELALADEISWTGDWVIDFEKILKDDANGDESMGNDDNDRETTIDNNNKLEDNNEEDDDIPVFNPVTGKLVQTSRPLRSIRHLEIDQVANNNTSDETENALVKKFSQSVTIKNTISTSAVYLQNRQWTGLGSDFQTDEEFDEEGAIVEMGRGGVARGYDYDVSERTKQI